MELTLGPISGMASNAFNSYGGNTAGGYNTVGGGTTGGYNTAGATAGGYNTAGATTGGYNTAGATGGYMSQTSNGYQQSTTGYNGASSTGALQNGGQLANTYGTQQNAYANRYGTGNTANLPLSATSSANAWSSGSNRGYPYSHANSMAQSKAYTQADIVSVLLSSFLPIFVIHIPLI
jgi:hypothetical protein